MHMDMKVLKITRLLTALILSSGMEEAFFLVLQSSSLPYLESIPFIALAIFATLSQSLTNCEGFAPGSTVRLCLTASGYEIPHQFLNSVVHDKVYSMKRLESGLGAETLRFHSKLHFDVGRRVFHFLFNPVILFHVLLQFLVGELPGVLNELPELLQLALRANHVLILGTRSVQGRGSLEVVAFGTPVLLVLLRLQDRLVEFEQLLAARRAFEEPPNAT